jgi:hypothetical protein
MTSHDTSVATVPPRADQRILEPTRRRDSRDQRSLVEGVATAFELSGPLFGQMHALRDLAFTNVGLEAECAEGISCGTTVSIGFQSRAHSARRGRVMTCERHMAAYHIAVAIEPNPFTDR